MSNTLLLPPTDVDLPEGVEKVDVLEWATNICGDPQDVRKYLADINGVTRLLGSDSTPPLIWLFAIKRFPSAECRYLNGGTGRWLIMGDGGVDSKENTSSNKARLDEGLALRLQNALMSGGRPQKQKYYDRTEADLLFQIFLRHAWGNAGSDAKQQLEAFESEAAERGLSADVNKARTEGKLANRLASEARTVWDKKGEKVARQWIDEHCESLPHSVSRHLNAQCKKWCEHQHKLRNRYKDRSRVSSLLPVQVVAHHPNSLRHLSPAQSWRIYIDETGTTFDESARDLSNQDTSVGRVVAVAVPDYAELEAISTEFHAAEAHGTEVDHLLQRLNESQVGILGLTVKDPLAKSASWIGHVHILARWVLMQLPLTPGTECTVELLIYSTTITLTGQRQLF